jgi:hypothetical protein
MHALNTRTRSFHIPRRAPHYTLYSPELKGFILLVCVPFFFLDPADWRDTTDQQVATFEQELKAANATGGAYLC